MDLIILELVCSATIAITLFGVVFSLTQTQYSRVRQSFALFLGAVALNNVPDALVRVFEAMPDFYTHRAELILWQPSSLCLAPLFWNYVYSLTSTDQKWPKHLWRHFSLPALAVLVGVVISVLPQDAFLVFLISDTVPFSGWQLALLILVLLLNLAVYLQVAVYLFFIVRRMMRYRLKLRDYYASTEEHELRWIYLIAGLGWLFWVAMTLVLLFAFDADNANGSPAFLSIVGIAALALMATTTLWGLRQRPPLVPDTESHEALGGLPIEPLGKKYEKSALSDEAATRLTRKLKAAMETDHLHRDPNLSLWALARHTGASPNYISQTLNEIIGESFFDFVNRYRIAEAMTLLTTTDDTVLTITYDVGFNSRSAFYNAFNRVTGQTPSGYRKKMSAPIGVDDVDA